MDKKTLFSIFINTTDFLMLATVLFFDFTALLCGLICGIHSKFLDLSEALVFIGLLIFGIIETKRVWRRFLEDLHLHYILMEEKRVRYKVFGPEMLFLLGAILIEAILWLGSL